MLKNSRISFHFHPLLYAAYPTLALLAANVSQIYYVYTLRSLFVSLGLAIIIYALLLVAFRNWEKAARAATILLVFVFSYGHVLYFLRAVKIFGLELGRHSILILPYLSVFTLAIIWVVRRKQDLKNLNSILDAIALVLLLFPLIKIFTYNMHRSEKPTQTASAKMEGLATAEDETLPDIYYIILDGYARQDKLLHDFDFDNQEFVTKLRELGFYVADCNRSNYNITDFSLASSLNMDYLTAFGDDYRSSGNDRQLLPSLITNNRVRALLEDAGYQVMAFETGYYFTEWWNADTFLAPNDHLSLYQSLRPFEAMLLRSTIALALSDSQVVLFDALNKNMDFPYNDHVNRVHYALDKLPTLSSMNGPKFVFLHILVPHKPLVFDAEGNIQQDSGFYSNSGDPINGDYFRKGYIEETEFINSKLPAILKSMIEQSEVKPVIILNSDHGVWWGVKPSHANLGAYYLPDGGNEKLYSSLSNVNVFRIVFNQYFGTDYELLPDISYNLDDSTENGFAIQPEYLPGCMTE